MDENDEQEDKSEFQIITVAIISLIIVLVLWFTNWQTLDKEQDRGTFGDMFGAVNALFSGLAFAGIIITIYYQNGQIEQQRKDFKAQKKNYNTQQFENTYFQMIGLYQNIVSNIQRTDSNSVINKGKDAFEIYVNDIQTLATRHIQNYNHFEITRTSTEVEPNIINYDDLTKDQIVEFYDIIYSVNKNSLAHYFRTVYHILKLIHNTDDIDKKFYVSLFRSQLSNSEQAILIYNSLHINGVEKFKVLAEDYSLFKNFSRIPLTTDNIITEIRLQN